MFVYVLLVFNLIELLETTYLNSLKKKSILTCDKNECYIRYILKYLKVYILIFFWKFVI